MRYTIAASTGGLPISMKNLIKELKVYITTYDFIILPKVEDPVLDLNARVNRFAYSAVINDYHVVIHMYNTGELMAITYNTKKYGITKTHISDGLVMFEMTYKKHKKRTLIACMYSKIEGRDETIITAMHILSKLKLPRVIFGDMGFLTADPTCVDGTMKCKCCGFSMYHKDYYMWRNCVCVNERGVKHPSSIPGYMRSFNVVTFSV